MTLSLEQLRHTAKETMAVAVSELFPGTLLIGGEVDEIGFFYDFVFSESIMTIFGQRELDQIEDHLFKIIIENRLIQTREMMRENAAIFLEHLGQFLQAKQAAESPDNILSLVQINQHYSLCPIPVLKATGELKAVKIQSYVLRSGKVIRIYGTAFFEKKELKEYLKKIRFAFKNDAHKAGEKHDYFFQPQEGGLVWFPEGEALQWSLLSFWRQFHRQHGYALVSCASSLHRKEIHSEVLQLKNLSKVASIGWNGHDLATTCYSDSHSEQQVLQVLISSLQFFLEAFKIFAFENLVCCSLHESSLFVRALEHLKIKWIKESRLKEKESVTFNTLDGYGRRVILSKIELEEKKQMVHHMFFYSIDSWMIHCMEKGVKKFEFEDQ